MPVPFSLSMPTHALFTTVSYGSSLRSQITHFFIPGPRLTAWDFFFAPNGQPGRFSLFHVLPSLWLRCVLAGCSLSLKSVANTALLLAKYGDKGSRVAKLVGFRDRSSRTVLMLIQRVLEQNVEMGLIRGMSACL